MSLILPKVLTEEALRATGISFGVKNIVTKDMKPFVVEVTPNGNPIFDLNKTLDKLSIVGKFAATCKNPVVYATDIRFSNALKSFGESTKIPVVYGRFMPGALTNPQMRYFMECDLLIVSDPNNGLPKENALIRVFSGDRRAMQEATEMQIPVVAICNTNSLLEDVDVAIPANNVGMKAIATIYYLLARAIQLNRGQLSAEQDVAPLSSFETEVPEPEEEE